MENGQEFDLPSGAKLHVSPSSFAQAKALQDALLAELRGKGLGALDVAAIQKAIGVGVAKRAGDEAPDGVEDAGLNMLVDRFLAVASSREVEAALFACAEKAVYKPGGSLDGAVQVTQRLFDDPKLRDAARRDFYAICHRVAEVNIRPFVEALFSMYAAHVGSSADTRPSSSETGPMKQPS